MSISVNLVDLVSWFFTILSIILYFTEKRKNKPYYMAMQGIFKALNEKVGFYASKVTEVRNKNENSISKDVYLLFVEMTYADYRSLKELVLGVMMAIDPDTKLEDTKNKNKAI